MACFCYGIVSLFSPEKWHSHHARDESHYMAGISGNTNLLHQVVAEISSQCKVRILVVNWWSLVAKETKEVFGDSGGHAGHEPSQRVL